MWRRLPSERNVAELYASSFLFKCADRHDSNLAQKSIGRQPTAQTSTDNRTAIKNEDTLLSTFRVPLFSCARFQCAKQCLDSTGTSVKKS
jgi:hypothetical protein